MQSIFPTKYNNECHHKKTSNGSYEKIAVSYIIKILIKINETNFLWMDMSSDDAMEVMVYGYISYIMLSLYTLLLE